MSLLTLKLLVELFSLLLPGTLSGYNLFNFNVRNCPRMNLAHVIGWALNEGFLGRPNPQAFDKGVHNPRGLENCKISIKNYQ